MSRPAVIAAALCLAQAGCQLDDAVGPTSPAAAVSPVHLSRASCGRFGGEELQVAARSGEHIIGGQRVAVQTDGSRVSWKASVGIDAVIVTGARGSNAYLYAGESTGDRELVAPSSIGESPDAIESIHFCYDWELDVRLTADVSRTRQTIWSIERAPARRHVTLARDQSLEVSQRVDVSVASINHGPLSIDGTVVIQNPAPSPAQVTGLELSAVGEAMDLRCGVTLPFEIAANEVVVCQYSAATPTDGAIRVVALTSGRVESSSAMLAVRSSDARVVATDECVDVRGHRGQMLGTTCRDRAPDRYEYRVALGPAACGRSRLSDVGVDIDVPCQRGCTRSARYWRSQGSAGAIDRTGRFGELVTELSAARQNVESGASPSGLEHALEAAAALSETYGAADLATPGDGGDALREQFRSVARQLREFNTGSSGPGACSE